MVLGEDASRLTPQCSRKLTLMVCRHFGQVAQTSRRLPIQVVNDKGRYRQLPGLTGSGHKFPAVSPATEIPIVIGPRHPWGRPVITQDAENDRRVVFKNSISLR